MELVCPAPRSVAGASVQFQSRHFNSLSAEERNDSSEDVLRFKRGRVKFCAWRVVESSECPGSAHMRRRGRWAEAAEILGWSEIAKGLARSLVVVSVGEGIDDRPEFVDLVG